MVKPAEPLTPDQVKAVVEIEIQDALGGFSSEVAEQRRKAIDYYYGKPFGNEQEGRSQVILTDVKDTIEWIMPSLIRIFLGGTHVVRYAPCGPGDEDFAEQATDYVNYLFLNKMPGFQILYDWMKTGLLEKNGIVKSYYETKVVPRKFTYRGLDEEQAFLLTMEEGVEVTGSREYERNIEGGVETVYDLEVRRMDEQGEIRVVGVPPEEFLIARRAIYLDDETPFSAHRVKRTASDLIAMGFDPETVYNLPSDDLPEYTVGRTARLAEDETFPVTTAERADPASRDIWTIECAIKIDEDGDGYSELRSILAVGEQAITVLDDVEINQNPFSSICPVPMPHKFFGESLADLVMDLQVIRSTLLRQMLDNLYLINNSRYEVVVDMVEIDDLLTSRPGGIVRVEQQGSVTPLVTSPLGPMAFNMLEYLEQVRETRTGSSRLNQGQDTSIHPQTTATVGSKLMEAANARIELIARIFANSGMKDLFQKILRLVIENDEKEKVIRLRNEWVTVNPSHWNPDMHVEVQVGLGVGQAAERVAQLFQILELQAGMHERGLGNYLVEPEHVFNAADQVTNAMGFKVPGMFFADPKGKEPPEPEPDPKLIELQAKQQQEAAKLEVDKAKVAMEQARLAYEREKDDKDRTSKETIELARIAMQKQIGLAQVEAAEKRAADNGAAEETA